MAFPSLPNISNGALALSNLILATPQDTNTYQPQSTGSVKQPTLVFHYEGENRVTLKADITDHYVEDNTSIQDQIAIRPTTIQTDGFIGELNDIVPPILALLKRAADKLTVISGYTPQLSLTALRAYQKALLAYETAATVANAAVSAWSSLTGDSQVGGALNSVTSTLGLGNLVNPQTKQAAMFQQFQGYFNAPARTFFTVQTPWGKFDNCAIETLTAIQDAETRVISNFEVGFKQIRVANTITTGSLNLGQGRWGEASTALAHIGSQTLTTSPTAFNSQFGVA